MPGSFDVVLLGVLACWHSAMDILTVNTEKMSSAAVSNSILILIFSAVVEYCCSCVYLSVQCVWVGRALYCRCSLMESGELFVPRTGTLTFPSLLANSSAIRGIETPSFTHLLHLCPILLQEGHCPPEFSSQTQIKHTRNNYSRALGLLEASRQVC